MSTMSEELTGPAVGDPITSREQLDKLPVGAVLRAKTGGEPLYVKHEDGEWSGGTRTYSADWFSLTGLNIIESLPDGVPDDGEVPASQPPTTTLARYQQRLRTLLIGAASERLRDQAPAERVLEKAGCPSDFLISPGMVVSPADSDLLGRLPAGTVLFTGDPDTDPLRHAVFGWDGYTVMPLLGNTGVNVRLYTVESIPDVPTALDWVRLGPSDSEAERIAAFQREVWHAGWEEKEANEWCSEYEDIMRTVAGLTEANALPPPTVSAAGCRALPVGTIVRYRSHQGSVLLVRDARAGNPAGTVRIGGSLPGSWASRHLEVVYNPEGGSLNIVPLSHEEMDGMPVGTVVRDETGRRWTRRGDGRWSLGRHTFHSTDFSPASVYYSRFPLEAS